MGDFLSQDAIDNLINSLEEERELKRKKKMGNLMLINPFKEWFSLNEMKGWQNRGNLMLCPAATIGNDEDQMKEWQEAIKALIENGFDPKLPLK